MLLDKAHCTLLGTTNHLRQEKRAFAGSHRWLFPGIHPFSSTTLYPKHATAPRRTSLYRSKYKPSEWLLMPPRISELIRRPESFSSLYIPQVPHGRSTYLEMCHTSDSAI
jgi:hypothetical protein